MMFRLNILTQILLAQLGQKLQGLLQVKVKHVAIVLPLLALILCAWFMAPSESSLDTLYCYRDYVKGGRVVCLPTCPKHHFILPGMSKCHKMLNCNSIKSNALDINNGVGTGAVKLVYLASWKGYDVAVNALANQKYKEDFLHGLGMLHRSQQSHRVTQLLGYCGTTFVSEYHPLGDASKVLDLLQSSEYSYMDTLSLRFGLCIDYAQIIAYFHTHPTGTRVFCDSNTLSATLQQFLITSGFRLIANDLDALPQVTVESPIHCGHRPIYSTFAAPEQRWPNSSVPYDEKLLPGYDEKVDIWKIPDVCEHFLGTESETVKFHLFKLHSQCKSNRPEDRPNATFVLSEYMRIQDQLNLS